MTVRVLWVVVMVLAVGAAGCKRKKSPTPAPADPEPAPTQKVDPDREPEKSPSGGAPSGGSGGGGGIIPGAGIGVVVNPQAALGGGGGGGAVQAVRKAARRASTLNDMKTLGEVIELMRDEFGKMPTKERIEAELQRYPALMTAVKEGAIVLTGTTEGGGLWAYEVDADTIPGIALIGGRATRSTPDELRQYFPARPQPAPRPTGGIDNRPAPKQAAPQPAPGAAATVTRQDMEDVRIYIDNASGVSGQMPTPQVTYGALQQASPKTAALVYSRAITLVPARTREGVWAYETAALQRGGLVTGSNGTETVTADELRRRLGVR